MNLGGEANDWFVRYGLSVLASLVLQFDSYPTKSDCICSNLSTFPFCFGINLSFIRQIFIGQL